MIDGPRAESAPAKSRPQVTVVTVTRRRPHLVGQAIASVQRQQGRGRSVEHLVLVNDCRETLEMLDRTSLPENVRYRFMTAEPGEELDTARIARLRNLGAREAKGAHVAFLDDDNTWEETHLETLLSALARAEVPAAFSGMRLWLSSGEPFLEALMPWFSDRAKAEHEYQRRLRRGRVELNDNYLLNLADPVDAEDCIRDVDMGEWLVTTELLELVPIPEEFSRTDLQANTTEDDKWLDALGLADVPMTSSDIPTLNYRLGGVSNRWGSM